MAAASATGDAGLKLRAALGRLLFTSPLYPLSLAGRKLSRLELVPEDPWPGDVATANALFRGCYRFAGAEINAPNQPPWHPQGASPAWLAELHGFAWLRHFSAAGGDAARRQARALVGSWLSHHQQWDRAVWQPEVLARRLVSWFSHAGLLFDPVEPALQAALLDGMARQGRHLARAIGHTPPGPGRITAAMGLIFSGLCLADGKGRLARGLKHLEQELAAQVLPDGGHVGRNPSLHLAVLRDLVTLRGALGQGQQEVPQALQNAIDRMAPMLRFFRHGDGCLALFNGSSEEPDGAVDLTLARAEAKGKAPASAPHCHFERLAAKRTLALLDVGAPPPAATGATAHAGLLSFELSLGRERLVVNCGAPENAAGPWARAMRATAAHSTLVLADHSSVALDAGGHLEGAAPRASCSRNEADGSTWIEAEHDGYMARFGLRHRRRLYLDGSGDDIRGEDSLSGETRHPVAFAIRFHLHPLVNASLVQNGVAVLLKLPGGTGFRLRAQGGAVSLDESIYLGDAGQQRRAEQIVISGLTEGQETTVKWAITRLTPAGGE